MGTERQRAIAWLGLLVSAGFAYLAVRDVDFGEVWDGLAASNYWWLPPSLAMLAITVYVKAIRWRYLFAAESGPPTGPVVRSLLIGYFFNSILPGRPGEVARVLALKQQARTPLAESAATVVVERIYDVLILLVLLFVSVPWLPHVSWIHTAAALAIALATILAGSMIVLAIWGLGQSASRCVHSRACRS